MKRGREATDTAGGDDDASRTYLRSRVAGWSLHIMRKHLDSVAARCLKQRDAEEKEKKAMQTLRPAGAEEKEKEKKEEEAKNENLEKVGQALQEKLMEAEAEWILAMEDFIHLCFLRRERVGDAGPNNA